MTSNSAASGRQALELLTLAQRDQVAVQSFSKLPEVDFSIIAFHAQQCIEKCMKAVLSKHGITYPRTHDLDDLCEHLLAGGLDMPVSRELLNDITPYAVTSRYEVDAEDLVTFAQIDEAVATTVSWASSHTNP
jgi:HEPN domain-containing protein